MRKLFFILLILSTVYGCPDANQNESTDLKTSISKPKNSSIDPNFIKVYVDEKGLITANGHSVFRCSGCSVGHPEPQIKRICNPHTLLSLVFNVAHTALQSLQLWRHSFKMQHV